MTAARFCMNSIRVSTWLQHADTVSNSELGHIQTDPSDEKLEVSVVILGKNRVTSWRRNRELVGN